MDYVLLGIDELLAEREAIDKEINDRAIDELRVIETRRQKLMKIANISEPKEIIVDELAEKRQRKSAAPKYRNPDNAEETWTGRGKKPGWMITWIENGRDPADLLIEPDQALAA